MTDAKSDPRTLPLTLAPAAAHLTRRADGSLILENRQRLGFYPGSLLDPLEHWARATPNEVFLAERSADGAWRRLTYAGGLQATAAIGQSLIARGAGPERPVCILSENSIDHALLTLGAMAVGVPASSISTAYALQSRDHAKLKQIVRALTPGLVYVADGVRYGAALAGLAGDGLLDGVEIVTSGAQPEGRRATQFTSLLATQPADEYAERRGLIGPDTIAKVLFTSGSTGAPKGVINTHRMLCSNQQALAQLWPFLQEKRPVILDWLPWSHTFGANHNFNLVLMQGGTLYIDEGKPAPGLIEKTVANLREVSPTLTFNVPRGYDMLLPYLESDAALRESFCRNLDLIFYAGAALPQPLWERLEAVSLKARGAHIPMVSSWGSTETAPIATCVHYPIDRAGIIGLPAPGNQIKMVPSGDKFELRVKGPCVTPGYWRQPEMTAQAFDAEGFYGMGDAGRLADPERPERGIVFDGRIAEDFKLLSGTWVHVGALRVALIAALAPLVADAVITGHDREETCALVFANVPAMRALCPDLPADAPATTILAHDAIRQAVSAGLRNLASQGAGSSGRIARVLLMEEPASIDANEITDKGYINQRAVLTRRSVLVDALYGGGGDQPIVGLVG
jgi:feruloyl-CoA synthase